MQIQRIAIIGPGLIGGSLALAARQRGVCAHLSLWSRDAQERAAARPLGLAGDADLVTDDLAAAVAGADLVVLCVPPAALVEVARRLAPHLEPNAAVCDVASIKAGVTQELAAIFSPAKPPALAVPPSASCILHPASFSRFVGAHPMAGGERSGPGAARADLFDGAVCLLTPDHRTAPDALAAVEAFWTALGARTRRMTPEAHDRNVAMISHLPHVLAAALVHFVGTEAPDAPACAGPGWRDVTRIAGGSPDLWTDILSRNRAPVTSALHGMIAKLQETLGYLAEGREGELQKFLAEARSQRDSSGEAG